MVSIEDKGLDELLKNIFPFWNYFKENKLNLKSLSGKDGVYAFWWMNDEDFKVIKSLNLDVVIKGKQNRKSENSTEKFIVYETKWDLTPIVADRICLYVGKSHDIANRVEQHLYQSFKHHWYKHNEHKLKFRLDNMLLKRTTACQLRAGIEHLYKFRVEGFNFHEILKGHIGISFYRSESALQEDKMKERFYLEDLAIGYLKPLFNLDSER